MGKGTTNRHKLHLPRSVAEEMKGLQRWADYLPLARIGADVSHSAVQSVPTGGSTAMQFDTVRFDSDGFWSAADNTKLTCPRECGGWFEAVFEGGYATAGGPTFSNIIMVNGVPIARLQIAPNSNMPFPGRTRAFELKPGDYVQAMTHNITGGAINANALATASTINPVYPHFSITRLHL